MERKKRVLSGRPRVPPENHLFIFGTVRVCGGAVHGAKIGFFRDGKTVRNVFDDNGDNYGQQSLFG